MVHVGWSRMFTLVVATLALTGCLDQEIGTGSGSITVHNRDSKDYPIVITDTPDSCVVGLKSSLEDNTARMFSVGDSSYLCMPGASTGTKVEDGKSYVVSGGNFHEGE